MISNDAGLTPVTIKNYNWSTIIEGLQCVSYKKRNESARVQPVLLGPKAYDLHTGTDEAFTFILSPQVHTLFNSCNWLLVLGREEKRRKMYLWTPHMFVDLQEPEEQQGLILCSQYYLAVFGLVMLSSQTPFCLAHSWPLSCTLWTSFCLRPQPSLDLRSVLEQASHIKSLGSIITGLAASNSSLVVES